LDDLPDLINSLVNERADILLNEKISRDEEVDWLSRALHRLEKGETFHMIADVDGKVAAISEINLRSCYEKHVGVIGITIRSNVRDLGIGTEIMKALIEQAQKK